MKIAFYSLIVLFIAGYTYQKDQKMSEEMGHDIDGTLVPYRKLSSMKVFIGNYPYATVVPCCEKDESKYSGCAKGLSGCK